MSKRCRGERGPQWFGAKSIKNARIQGDTPETAHVFKDQLSPSQANHDSRMAGQGSGGWEQIQPARHPEVGEEKSRSLAVVQGEEQVFPPPRDCPKACVAQGHHK
jgi:hypothetical protein